MPYYNASTYSFFLSSVLLTTTVVLISQLPQYGMSFMSPPRNGNHSRSIFLPNGGSRRRRPVPTRPPFQPLPTTTMGSQEKDPSSSSSSASTSLSSSAWALMESIPFDQLHRIQRLGENLFAGMLSVALLQGLVALGQYRTNPSGQLINPPGLTRGIAKKPSSRSATSSSQLFSSSSSSATNGPNISDSTGSFSTQAGTQNETLLALSSSSTAASAVSIGGNTINSTTTTNATATPSSTLSQGRSQYAQIVNTINKWLVVLVPFAGRQFSYLLQRNTHLFHLGFIVTLARVFDLPHQWFGGRQLSKCASTTDAASLLVAGDAPTPHPNNNSDNTPKPIQNVVVLGDSLAVGLGSVNVFDSGKNNSAVFERVENLGHDGDDNDNSDDDDDDDADTGPVFPRVLAETLATQEDSDISWRSAGVDGGDTESIHKYCLGVIQEEVQAGRSPDLVVLLLGVNDLKYYISGNPLWGRSPGPRAFRQRLCRLIGAIYDLAPDCTVVLPSMPTQMVHKNSPLNIVPFNLFMDSLLGFWDSLKMRVAMDMNRETNLHNDTNDAAVGKVLYLRTNPEEVLRWYKAPNPIPVVDGGGSDPSSSDKKKEEELGLIAADGVHPNAKCYALWAQSLASQLLQQLSPLSSPNIES